MNIEQIIDSIHPIPDHSKRKLIACIREVHFLKQHLLLRAGTIETKLYFVKKGIVRAYASQADHEVTFWFGKEGETVVSMKSYVQNEPGYENIALLEPGEFYELQTEDLQQLFSEDIHIANWGRKFAEQELIKTEERLISRQFKTALERYKHLLKERPELLLRVPLGHIASYLGITQVSLSRIRAEIR